MNRPNANDTPQGSTIEEWDSGEGFTSITWWGYSPNTGEYNAVSAQWKYDEENQLIYLERVAVKYPYQAWSEFLTAPANMLSDPHLRMVRSHAAEHFGMQRFKKRTRLYPKED